MSGGERKFTLVTKPTLMLSMKTWQRKLTPPSNMWPMEGEARIGRRRGKERLGKEEEVRLKVE